MFAHYQYSLIVEFRIPGYPGPSKELDMEVRLMRGKIFRSKIRMYFSVQLYVDRNYDKHRKELLKMSVKAHKLAYLSVGDCLLISLDIGI